ncbi:hypothetical protein LCGC14_2907000 [marine sediment metagenome]|uniref:Uncharacterized protein n=1 Tax=marine sediment metagenome TaxID=412755 RepID=A0A0F8XSP8_9ZZZZ
MSFQVMCDRCGKTEEKKVFHRFGWYVLSRHTGAGTEAAPVDVVEAELCPECGVRAEEAPDAPQPSDLFHDPADIDPVTEEEAKRWGEYVLKGPDNRILRLLADRAQAQERIEALEAALQIVDELAESGDPAVTEEPPPMFTTWRERAVSAATKLFSVDGKLLKAEQRIGKLEAALREAVGVLADVPTPDSQTLSLRLGSAQGHADALLTPPTEEVRQLRRREGWAKPPGTPIEEIATRAVIEEEDEEAQHVRADEA